jgi:hypothetical protein
MIASTRISGTDWALSLGTRGVDAAEEIEIRICEQLREMSPNYTGGIIHYHALSNSGFFVAPEGGAITIDSSNGRTETISSEAAGVVATLFVLNRLHRQQPSPQSPEASNQWRDTFGTAVSERRGQSCLTLWRRIPRAVQSSG